MNFCNNCHTIVLSIGFTNIVGRLSALDRHRPPITAIGWCLDVCHNKNTNASRRQEFFRHWTVSLELSACRITWQRYLTCTVWDFWRHFGLCRAAAHSDCCFFFAVYKYFYLLTYLFTYYLLLLLLLTFVKTHILASQFFFIFWKKNQTNCASLMTAAGGDSGSRRLAQCVRRLL